MSHSSKLNNHYNAMKQRCYCCNNINYKYYGGRGIKVCDEWTNTEKVSTAQQHHVSKGYLAFQEWALSHGYEEGLTLDRIDVNKDYSPDNCRWVSMEIQNNNTRKNHFLTYNGKTQSLADWCKELNLNYNTTKTRLNRSHWSVERAFEST